jgi:predicted phage replisome organizer
VGVIKWIKLSIGIYEDEKIRLIDSMPNRDTLNYVWIRLLIQAGKNNAKGRIYLNKNISYTKAMLSILFNRPIEVIEEALKIFIDLDMIEIDKNNIISILNWEKHQNIEGMEKVRDQTRKRVEKYRTKLKAEEGEIREEDSNISSKYSNVIEETLMDSSPESCNVTVTRQNETKKKSKNKIENKIENDTGLNQEVGEKTENESFIISEGDTQKDIVTEADLIEYIKKIPGKIKGANSNSIKLAVSTHHVENVKLAIDKAVEVNRLRMNYINGILNNWKLEGYPTNDVNLSKSSYSNAFKNHKSLRFNNFEPRNCATCCYLKRIA